MVDAAGEIYGDPPNVAARVQALAEPGTVLVTARVQAQIAGLFVVEERGNHELKGVPEPVALFHLVRASGGGRRSGRRHLTPLVGREEEIATLMRRWERARQGEGQLVLIVGEPGIGKTRLIEEFRFPVARHAAHLGRVGAVRNSCRICRCTRSLNGAASVSAASTYQWSSVSQNMSICTPAQLKLDPVENAALLAPLVDIQVAQERAPSSPPDELRRLQLAAATNWVMAGARAQPMVLALEDLQWADPTTLDVLRGIAERGAMAALFVLMAARPEFRPLWGMRSHHCTIALALDREQVRRMVGDLAARQALPTEVIEDVAERTGGVPLFVEEVTQLVLDGGGQDGIHAIPPTLQQSLMARLDRLGAAREVAQIGAVIGRETFPTRSFAP